MKLYFVRHAESEANLNNAYNSDRDSLSPLGRRQAEAIAKRLSKIPIDLILSSDLIRAEETAAIISEEIGVKTRYSRLLREWKRPSVWAGKRVDDPEIKRVSQEMIANINHPTWHYADEENFHDLKRRAQKLLNLAEKLRIKNIAVITHGTILRTIILLVLLDGFFTADIFQSIIGQRRLPMENTGITICEYREGKWHLITWNDHAHLG